MYTGILSQAYFFEEDSDEHSGSDVSPLVRRPQSQSVNNTPHSHIFTGYLSAVEVVVLVSGEGGEGGGRGRGEGVYTCTCILFCFSTLSLCVWGIADSHSVLVRVRVYRRECSELTLGSNVYREAG